MKFCHLFLFQITASENSSMSIFTFFNRNFEIHFLRDLLAFFSCFSWVAFICCVRFAFITAFSHWFLQFCWNFLLLASFLGFQSAKLFFHFAILFHFQGNALRRTLENALDILPCQSSYIVFPFWLN